jgi:cell division protein FtsL
MSAAQPAASSAARQPVRRPERQVEQPREREFRVFTAEEKRARTQRFRARILLAMSAGVLAAAGLAVGIANVVVTNRQFQVDSLGSQVSAAIAQNQNLQLQRAELESAARIISIAEHRLGMVMPKSVIYLPAQPLPGAPAPTTKSGGGAHAGGHAPGR